MDYTMKEVTKMLGMTVHTVRHYTDHGLVPNLRRDKNGNRIFDEQSLNWLQASHFLRESGLSVAEIKYYFELCESGVDTFAERFQILKDLRDKTEQELHDTQLRFNCINEKLLHCEDIKAGLCEDDCNPLNWK